MRGPAVEEWCKDRVRERHAANAQLTDGRVQDAADRRAGSGRPAPRERPQRIANSATPSACGNRSTIYAWEQGRSRPTQPQFDAYLRAVGADADVVQGFVQAVPSRLEATWDTQYTGSGRNAVRDRVRLGDLDAADVEWFAARE